MYLTQTEKFKKSRVNRKVITERISKDLYKYGKQWVLTLELLAMPIRSVHVELQETRYNEWDLLIIVKYDSLKCALVY